MDDTKSRPSYEKCLQYKESPHTALTLDSTGMFIRPFSKGQTDEPPLYSLSSSLIKVRTGSSVQVKRLASKYLSPLGTDKTGSFDVYAIGELYIAALHSRNPLLEDIQVARSHGILAATHPEEREWDFVTNVPYPSEEGMDGVRSGGSVGPVGAWGLLGVSDRPGTYQRPLLKLSRGKWVSYVLNDDGELVAIENERSKESGGMPVLCVMKDLDMETMDLLLSAWCVRLWGHVKNDPSRISILVGT